MANEKRPPMPPDRAKSTQVNPAQLTRRQYIRYADEQRRIRLVTQIAFVIGALCLAILIVPIVINLLVLPNQPVASVNGTNISRSEYAKQRRWDIYNQVRQQVYFSSISGQAQDPLENPSIQQLRRDMGKVNEDPINPDSLESLIDSTLLRQKATSEFGITGNRAEVISNTVKQYEPAAQPPTPTPGPAITSTTTASNTVTSGTVPSSTTALTPTATTIVTPTGTPTALPTNTPGGPTSTPTATPTETPTYIPVAGARATAEVGYNRFIKDISSSNTSTDPESFCRYACPGLSEDDYYRIVGEPEYLRQEVTKKLEATVPTATLQLQLAQILTADENEARAAIADIQGGKDFGEVALARSTDESTKDQGGDMGYVPAGVQSPEFDAAVFTPNRQAGTDLIGPFKDTAGWHVVRVTGRQENRPLDGTQISALKGKVYDNWLAKAKQATTITRSVQPTPTFVPIPTLPPAPTLAPTEAGTATTPAVPAASTPLVPAAFSPAPAASPTK